MGVAVVTPYFEDESCTLYNEDALEVLPLLDRSGAHAVVTDPPYVIGAVSAGNMGSKAGGWADMMNSALWFSAWYQMVGRCLRPDGVFWSFCNWRSLPVVMRAAIDSSLPITSLLVWDKESIGQGGFQGLRSSYELVALMAQHDFSIQDRGTADIWRHKVGRPNGHPAEKPLGLVKRLLSTSTLPADGLVVDPFMGSGTTGEAAKSLGLRFIGIEAEERWCEIAAKRICQGVLL